MAIYGITKYGEDVYGLSLPPAYLSTPFTAVPVNYSAIRVNWKQPSGVIFRYRLLSNRFGWPVNENDGNIIFDSVDYPASTYYDTGVIPGTYHYYAMYVLVDVGDNIWVRSGLAACLMPKNFGSAKWFNDHVPEYFRTNPVDGSSLTDDARGNSDLENFFNVVGWGFDYIRTQYAAMAEHLNDPQFIPLDDLWNMAAEVGLTFSAETPAYIVRKAVKNWAHISQQRGTVHGLGGEIALRTGWPADVTIGSNMILEDDQGQFLHPIFLEYSPNQVYRVNECVHHHNCWFRCLIDLILGQEPPAFGTSNSFWHFINDEDDEFNVLQNVGTNNPSTWELLDSTATNGIPAPGALTQGIGVKDPLAPTTNQATNSLRIYNKAGSAKTLWCRSVSRRNIELGNIPDPGFETGVTITGDQHTRRLHLPGNWPVIGQRFVNNVPAFWTPSNCTIVRTEEHAHGGLWAAKITADPADTPLATGQVTDPGFETGIDGWTATNCTINQSVDQAAAGTSSMKIVPANVPSPFVMSPQVTCVAGKSNTAGASLWMAGTTVSVRVDIHFYDASGNDIGSTKGTASAPTASTWTPYTATATAPSNAVTMALAIVYNGTPAVTNILYADTIVFSTPATAFGLATAQSPWFTCPAGTSVTGNAWFFSASALSTNMNVELQWYDSTGMLLSSSPGTAAALPNTTWTNYTCSGTAPAGTAYGALTAMLVNIEATDVVWMDDVGVVAGITQPSTWPVENIQAIQDGIPVPWVRNSQEWDDSRRYSTGDLVLYQGAPFKALRASKGAVPPTNHIATAEWAPLSQDRRIRVLHSAYLSQNISNGSNLTAQAIPFVEWFDKHGNFIARVFSRNPNVGGGVVAQPDSLTFDSFTGLSIVSGSGTGTITVPQWNATFWNNQTLSGSPSHTEIDNSLSFTWSGPPAAGVSDSGWSASWVGSFTAPSTGSYGFGLSQSGGGSRLFVNGSQIIDNWTTKAGGLLTGSITLNAGAMVTVQVDYFEDQAAGAIVSGNLVSGWTPGQALLANFTATSPVFAVAASDPFNFSIQATYTRALDTGTSDVTIAWLDSLGSAIGTSATGSVSTHNGVVLSLSGTIPAGASSAQITAHTQRGVGGTGSIGFTAPNFTETTPAATGAGTLSIGTISTPSSTSGLVVSTSLAGRHTDDAQSTWNVRTGNFLCGGFEGGTVWATDPAVRSLATIPGAANANVGVTFRTSPNAGKTQGLVFRYSDDNNYWRAGRTTLRKKVAGTFSTVATFSTPFSDNDRMVVQMNGSAIQVFRNGNNSVASVTDAFNSTAANHGIVTETT